MLFGEQLIYQVEENKDLETVKSLHKISFVLEKYHYMRCEKVLHFETTELVKKNLLDSYEIFYLNKKKMSGLKISK